MIPASPARIVEHCCPVFHFFRTVGPLPPSSVVNDSPRSFVRAALLAGAVVGAPFEASCGRSDARAVVVPARDDAGVASSPAGTKEYKA